MMEAGWLADGSVVVAGRGASCDYRIVDNLDGSGPVIERWEPQPKPQPAPANPPAKPERCLRCGGPLTGGCKKRCRQCGWERGCGE